MIKWPMAILLRNCSAPLVLGNPYLFHRLKPFYLFVCLSVCLSLYLLLCICNFGQVKLNGNREISFGKVYSVPLPIVFLFFFRALTTLNCSPYRTVFGYIA